MAVSGATLTTVANLLKTQYLPRVPFYFKQKYFWLSRLRRKVRQLAGNSFVHPAITEETQGIGAGAHTADLPTPGSVSTMKPSFGPKPHRGRVRVFGGPMYATKNQRGAYLRTWVMETNSLMRALRKDFNFEFLGDGRGVLGILGGNETGQTTLGSTNAITGFGGPSGRHIVPKGASVDIIDDTDDTTVILSAAAVSSVTGTTVTLDAAPGATASGDYIIRSGSLGYAFNGVDAAIDDGNPPLANFGGIDRTAAGNNYYQSQNVDFGNDFSLDKIDQLVDSVEEYSDGTISFLLMRNRYHRAFGRMLWDQVRFNGAGKLDGRWSSLQYMGKDFVADQGIKKNTMYCIDASTFEIAEVHPLGWMDMDGSVVFRVADKEAYEATATYHAALINYAPINNARGENMALPDA